MRLQEIDDEILFPAHVVARAGNVAWIGTGKPRALDEHGLMFAEDGVKILDWIRCDQHQPAHQDRCVIAHAQAGKLAGFPELLARAGAETIHVHVFRREDDAGAVLAHRCRG